MTNRFFLGLKEMFVLLCALYNTFIKDPISYITQSIKNIGIDDVLVNDFKLTALTIFLVFTATITPFGVSFLIIFLFAYDYFSKSNDFDTSTKIFLLLSMIVNSIIYCFVWYHEYDHIRNLSLSDKLFNYFITNLDSLALTILVIIMLGFVIYCLIPLMIEIVRIIKQSLIVNYIKCSNKSK